MKKKPDKKNVDVRKTAAETSRKSAIELKNAGIKKLYLKTRPACKIALRLPKEAAPDAKKVNIVGDFNNWEQDATVMKRLNNGDFTITVELQPGREYKFRYLIDDSKWENDWYADGYDPNPYGGDDSVIVV